MRIERYPIDTIFDIDFIPGDQWKWFIRFYDNGTISMRWLTTGDQIDIIRIM